ncbi:MULTISPECIES: hypothetical protein [unclassified Bradyrhizobium]|uniref:hypothetical protein n=1 Tax=unclassified Bradyrhizobium TaxID=2631580 RepID=UPI001FF9D11A|nr:MULTISPECIES: hypothetical protein [unclassified Bradyrhizobium]MCK1711241.1 hypothetical protein [Bradyrhizobium sp. 143]MCK1725512.1 hypothetical protein [Bradyrhizobium sp. 142]
MSSDDNRALRRALNIEREMRKLLERRLRELLQKDYEQFLKVCQLHSQREADLRLIKLSAAIEDA